MEENYKYLVIYQDEYNNLYYVGEFLDLDDARVEVNEMFDLDLEEGDLVVYASTFGPAFDLEVTENGDMVRGFVLDR